MLHRLMALPLSCGSMEGSEVELGFGFPSSTAASTFSAGGGDCLLLLACCN